MPPLASVLLPVRNSAATVGQALGSILRQTLQDLEVVVVDGGSSDGTLDLVRACGDPRVRVLADPGGGLVGALNAGLAACRGAYVARMDGDDVSHPTRLERQVAFLAANPEVGVVGSAVRFIGADGRPQGSYRYPTAPAQVAWKLNFGSYLAHPAVLMRASALPVPAYRLQARHVEDYDLWLRLRGTTRLANLPQALLDYRVSPGAVGQVFKAEQVAATVRLVQSNLEGLLGRPVPADAVEALVRSGRGERVPPGPAAAARRLLRDLLREAPAGDAPRGLVRRDVSDRLGRLALSAWPSSRREGLRGLALAATVAPLHALRRAAEVAAGRHREAP